MRKAAALALLVLATGCSTQSLRATAPHYVPFPRSTASGVLPNHALTPGAVTHATVRQICTPGYSARVRPPESYTEALKVKQIDSGYTYRGDRRLADYEEDHLVSLELGGSPTSVKNLWPEPYPSARQKDKIENKLHALVCSGQMSLSRAQRAIADDWRDAVQ